MHQVLMPSDAEWRELARVRDRAARTLARTGADPFHEGWDAVWEAGCVIDRPGYDTPERERACFDRLMAVLRRCA